MRSPHTASISVLAAIAVAAGAVCAQPMPSQKEIDEAMQKMQRQLGKLTPEQRRMIEQAYRQMATQPAPGAEDDEIVVPRRDAARIATVPKHALTGGQLKSLVEALQPKIASALTPTARQRAQTIEAAVRKGGGDTAAKLSAAANGLVAWGAWPKATYLTGQAALASGKAQDLNNLAAFLTNEWQHHHLAHRLRPARTGRDEGPVDAQGRSRGGSLQDGSGDPTWD